MVNGSKVFGYTTGVIEDNSGVLQVKRKDSTVWSAVCDNKFNDGTAKVICKSMGYTQFMYWKHAERIYTR